MRLTSLCLTGAMVLLLVSTPSGAKSILTEDVIRAFYAESIDVQKSSLERTLDFYKKHMRDDAVATLHLVSRIKGNVTDKQIFEFDKQKLLSETQKGHNISKILNIEGSVISVKISEDGQTAKVKNTFVSTSSSNVPMGNQKIKMIIEQSALCDDDVILSSQNVIQYTKSVCHAESLIDLPEQ